MKPIAYLDQCYSDDNQVLGYVAYSIDAYGSIPVVEMEVAERLLKALKDLLSMPDFDGTQATSILRRDAKHAAREAIAIAEEMTNQTIGAKQ